VIENQVAQRAIARQRVVGSELLARLGYYRSTLARGHWVSLVRSARLRAWPVAHDRVYAAKNSAIIEAVHHTSVYSCQGRRVSSAVVGAYIQLEAMSGLRFAS
jgi:hypothetical protein